MRTTSRATRGRRAFTVAEAMIATVVLMIAVVGVAALMNSVYAHAAAMRDTATALTLARELMDEIADKPYGGSGSNGWAQGQTDRAQYDEVWDYNGYTRSASSLSTLDGRTVSLSSDGTFTSSVVVQPCTSLSVLKTGDGAVVTVTVLTPGGQEVRLDRLATVVDPIRTELP